MISMTFVPEKILMLDTETANTLNGENGRPIMSYALPYDLGLAVVDRKGTVYETMSLVIKDIFFGERDLMTTAYYANKIPRYLEDIRAGRRQIVSAMRAKMIVRDLLEKYDIHAVCAHNSRFDRNALNNLDRWTTKSKYRYFLPYGVEIWDTMAMAQDTICQQPTFKRFCEKNGFVTKRGIPQKTAEVLYRYITHDTDFVESHTGLEDVLIETAIMAHCFRQHKKMRKGY